MYGHVLTAAIKAEYDLALIYCQHPQKDLGLYLIAIQNATIAFFNLLSPPKDYQQAHAEFIEWQERGIDALSEELRHGRHNASEAARQHLDTSQKLVRTLCNLAQLAQSNSETEIVCLACGSSLGASAKFCSQCGAQSPIGYQP